MRRIVGALLLLLVLVVSACSTPSSAPKPTMLVYGDSLTVLSEPAVTSMYGGKYNLIFRAEGGSAPCDFAPHAALDRMIYKPSRVVIAFTGNTSDCVVGNTPRPFRLDELLVNYESNMTLFFTAFQGLPVSVVGTPAMHDNIGWFPFNGSAALNAQYANESNEFGWSFVTYADDALSPGHVFTYTRPAYPGNGALVSVRTSDGIHLTPQGELYYARAIGN